MCWSQAAISFRLAHTFPQAASQVISPAASARASSKVTIFRQVPSRCQRRNSPYTDCQSPYRARAGATSAPVPDLPARAAAPPG